MATKNRENEASLIGSILKNSAGLEYLADIICPEDFDWQPYGWAWEAMLNLKGRGLSVDAVTVGDELERKDLLKDFQVDGGNLWKDRNALSFLRDQGDPRSVLTYAHNVKDYSAKKKLDHLCKDGSYWAENGRSAVDIMMDITKRMSEIKTFDGGAFKRTQTLAEAASEAYDHTDRASRSLIPFVPTGYIDLDRLLGGGMMAPDLLIIAGRPGSGKTAFLGSVARNVALKKKRVAIFSLEMQNKQLAMRLIAQECGVSYDKQKSGGLEGEEWARYTNAVERMADFPIVLNDLPAIRISQARQELRRMGQIDIALFDYIQLGGVDGKYDRRDQEIGEISGGLKSIAKEFQIPVLAAAQLSRAVEQRTSKRPILSDLRESGSLEQDADVVMFIHRDDYKKNTTNILVEKQRNGPIGDVTLMYRSELTRFENASFRDESR